MMLDIVNQAIAERKLGEYGGNMGSSIIGKATGEIKDKLSKGQSVSPADRKAAAQAMKTEISKMPKGTGTMTGVKEGVEEQSELI